MMLKLNDLVVLELYPVNVLSISLFIYLFIYLVLKRKGRDRCWWMLVGATGLGFPISKILKIFLATTTTTKTHLEFLFFFLLLQPSRNDG